MKKVIWLIVGVFIIGGGFAASSLFNDNTKNDSTKQALPEETRQEPINTEAAAVDPCTIFGVADLQKSFNAKFIEGVAIEKDTKTADRQTSSVCVYKQTNDGSEAGLASSYELLIIVKNYEFSEAADTAKSQRSEVVSTDQISLNYVKDKQLFMLVLSKKAGLDSSADKAKLQQLAEMKF